MEEKEGQKEDVKRYFSSDRVLITSQEAIIAGKAYKIDELRSASSTIFSRSIMEGIIYAVIGAIILFIGIFGEISIFTILGILLLCISAVKFIVSFVKPVYSIKLSGSQGNKTVFSSEDKELVEEIVGAINQAILDKIGK